MNDWTYRTTVADLIQRAGETLMRQDVASRIDVYRDILVIDPRVSESGQARVRVRVKITAVHLDR